MGGSSLNPGTGAPVIVRGINVTTTNGDSFGNLSATAGVLGNGGANADSIGVFATSAGALTNSTVPIDAVFFGTSIGTALVSGGNAGYQLPVNDKYVGGKLQSTSFVAPDPTSGNFTRATGTYNTNTNSWVTPRTFALSTAAQNAGVSTVDLVVPEPGTLALAGLGLLGLALRRRK